MNKILNTVSATLGSKINKNLTPIIRSYLLPIIEKDKYQKELRRLTFYVKYSLDYKRIFSSDNIPQIYSNCNKIKYTRAIDKYWEIIYN